MLVEFHRRFKWAPRFTSKLQILYYYGTTQAFPDNHAGISGPARHRQAGGGLPLMFAIVDAKQKISELREELDLYCIDTSGFSEKSDFTSALRTARETLPPVP